MNLQKIMQQAQEMQEKMVKMQDQLADEEVTGTSGGGMVEATVTGKGEVKNIKIDPEAVDAEDLSLLEDLIVAALNDGKAKAEELAQKQMSDMTAGMPLPPGFKMPF